MPRITKKQLEFVIDQMANTIRNTQELFNKAQGELEKLDGKGRMKILIEPKERLINSYYDKLYPHDDEEIDD